MPGYNCFMAKRVKLEWQWSGLCLNRAADTARVSQILMHSCTHAWTGFCESEQTFLRAGRAMSSHSPAASMCSGAATSATSCTHTRLPTWQLHHASFDSLYSDALLNTQMPCSTLRCLVEGQTHAGLVHNIWENPCGTCMSDCCTR